MKPEISIISNATLSILFLTTIIAATTTNAKDLLVEVNINNTNGIKINYTLNLDWSVMTFSSTILFITAVTAIFTNTYIISENKKNEFSTLNIMFVSSILLIASSPNLISIMLGWDGLGITSFYLVIFYQNQLSLESGLVTVYSNRIGDLSLIITIATSNEYLWTAPNSSLNAVTTVAIAAMTNSAQVPFSAWLPAAIAAPTPVSTLVHSSTLVTAGIWIINRFPEATNINWLKNILALVAVATTILAGITAFKENDLNNIVAISTLSQLGIIMLITSIKINNLTMFHINVHALFNALLFICVGSMIEGKEGAQNKSDINLSSYTSASAINVSALNLISLPITSGFFSKDFIIEAVEQNMTMTEVGAFLTTATLTIAYSSILMNSSVEKGNISNNESNGFNESTSNLTLVLIPALLISILTENTMTTISSAENNAWIVIIACAVAAKIDGKEISMSISNIVILPWNTANEESNNNNNENTDNSWTKWLLKSTTGIAENVNNMNNNSMNESLVSTGLILVIIVIN